MNGRDDKGRFEKGHEAIVSNRKTGNLGGRPKTLRGEVRGALSLAEDAMPDIIKGMIDRAKDPLNRDSQRASEYLIDRIYGKATQPLNSDGEVVFRVIYDRGTRGVEAT